MKRETKQTVVNLPDQETYIVVKGNVLYSLFSREDAALISKCKSKSQVKRLIAQKKLPKMVDAKIS